MLKLHQVCDVNDLHGNVDRQFIVHRWVAGWENNWVVQALVANGHAWVGESDFPLTSQERAPEGNPFERMVAEMQEEDVAGM